MCRLAIDIALRHGHGLRDPLAEPHPWYVLVQLSSAAQQDLRTVLEEALEAGIEKGLVGDAAVADSLEHRRAFWLLRETLPETQKGEGGSIKHDISVPVAAVPDFLREAGAAVEALIPGSRPVPFGHLGDGNIHYNISQPVGADTAAFLARWYEMNEAVHRRGREIRRLDLGRARHRRDEAQALAAGEGPGRARSHAYAQAHARPEQHPQPRQGLVRAASLVARMSAATSGDSLCRATHG